MPGQTGMGGNDTVVMPNSFQAAPTAAPMPGAAPMNNTMPNMMPNPAAPTAAPAAMPAPNVPNLGTSVAMPNPNVTAAVPANMPVKRDTTLIETVILIIVCLIAAAAIVFAVIFFMQYNELKTNYDTEKSLEVEKAKKEQADLDNASFEEREKLPNYHFTGPSDYGSISFEYPKTWSLYIESDGTNNSDYKAYFSPAQVNPLKDKNSRYALRFSILNRQYDTVQKTYESKVKSGKLTSSMFTADDNTVSGIKYEGELETNMNGIVVLVKVNDKTALFQMDADVYRGDFETLIKGIRRNS